MGGAKSKGVASHTFHPPAPATSPQTIACHRIPNHETPHEVRVTQVPTGAIDHEQIHSSIRTRRRLVDRLCRGTARRKYARADTPGSTRKIGSDAIREELLVAA